MPPHQLLDIFIGGIVVFFDVSRVDFPHASLPAQFEATKRILAALPAIARSLMPRQRPSSCKELSTKSSRPGSCRARVQIAANWSSSRCCITANSSRDIPFCIPFSHISRRGTGKGLSRVTLHLVRRSNTPSHRTGLASSTCWQRFHPPRQFSSGTPRGATVHHFSRHHALAMLLKKASRTTL